MVVIALGAMLAGAAAQVFAQIPAPPGAENVRRAVDESQGYPALRFELHAELPDAPAERFYEAYFSALAWTPCDRVGLDPEWPSYVDAMVSPPKRVFTRTSAWIDPTGDIAILVNTSYRVELHASPAVDGRVTQSILVGVISPRQAFEEVLREYRFACPAETSPGPPRVPSGP